MCLAAWDVLFGVFHSQVDYRLKCDEMSQWKIIRKTTIYLSTIVCDVLMLCRVLEQIDNSVALRTLGTYLKGASVHLKGYSNSFSIIPTIL